MFRSLAFKLTMAFLVIGVTGVGLVAVLVRIQTEAEFDRFVDSHYRALLEDILTDYFVEHQSWDDVSQHLRKHRYLGLRGRDLALVDGDGVVVRGDWMYKKGASLDAAQLDGGLPITVDDTVVGYVLFDDALDDEYNTLVDGVVQENDSTPTLMPPASIHQEHDFRHRVSLATALSAFIAIIIAVLVGWILARTLTNPLRALTEATEAMAAGDVGNQVTVHGKDEIGTLATSFNQMSTNLANASRLRQQMTADIAHDLRTPLSILGGYMEGLQRGDIQGTPKLYGIMYEEVQHLQHLVDDLRTLSLADAGKLTLNRRAVDPKALLERTGLAYIMQAEQKGLKLRIDAPDGLPSVSVDLERITQVLNNLVSNAIQYTSEGEIVLSATATNESDREETGLLVTLAIQDTGVGIAADELPLIFNRFYRADDSRQRSSSGSTASDGVAQNSSSGLGLAIAKAIVEAHGGTIAAESVLGEGTRFVIQLP
ncbi:MAG: ATP-binding protein [Chloroflexota bacterium]